MWTPGIVASSLFWQFFLCLCSFPAHTHWSVADSELKKTHHSLTYVWPLLTQTILPTVFSDDIVHKYPKVSNSSTDLELFNEITHAYGLKQYH